VLRRIERDSPVDHERRFHEVIVKLNANVGYCETEDVTSILKFRSKISKRSLTWARTEVDRMIERLEEFKKRLK
jgi:hypothetical protein